MPTRWTATTLRASSPASSATRPQALWRASAKVSQSSSQATMSSHATRLTAATASSASALTSTSVHQCVPSPARALWQGTGSPASPTRASPFTTSWARAPFPSMALSTHSPSRRSARTHPSTRSAFLVAAFRLAGELYGTLPRWSAVLRRPSSASVPSASASSRASSRLVPPALSPWTSCLQSWNLPRNGVLRTSSTRRSFPRARPCRRRSSP
mmetsp:Transcript_72067/g.233113  ORF Transcript_72067/g.233113 Transcript_72067/m.233113 type:complete len:213 (+) Transcript_72067:941-1579(+)